VPRTRVNDLDAVPAHKDGNCGFELGITVTLKDLERFTTYKERIKSVSNLLCDLVFQRLKCDKLIEVVFRRQNPIIRAGKVCAHVDQVNLTAFICTARLNRL
jgi:hypothetical protein